jgi:hypothetical protein
LERALFISKEKNLQYLKGDYERVYFGHEFCEKLLPSAKVLAAIMDYVQAKGLPLTLVTPYVTESGIRKVEKLLAVLPGSSEVVFNDWGVLRIVRKEFPDLEPILGRLLTKIKRGPRIAHVLDSLPSDALQHLCSTNLGVPIYQRFLKEHHIQRVEIDNPLQELNVSDVPRELKLSVYIPFAYVTTTRFCLVANCDIPEKKGLIGVFPCHQECKTYTFYLKSPVMPVLLIRKGNTLFYKNPKIPRNLQEKNINRLIIQPEIPF